MNPPKSRLVKLLRLALVPVLLAALGGCVTPKEKLAVNVGNGPLGYHDVSFSSDGRQLASINQHARSAIVFDTGTGNELSRFKPSELKGLNGVQWKSGWLGIASVAFTSDNRLLVACWLKRNRIAVWDASRSILLAEMCHPKNTGACALSPDGSRIAYAGTNGAVVVHDLSAASTGSDLRAGRGRPLWLRFSPAGNLLAIIDNENDWHIVDISSGEALRTLGKRKKDSIGYVSFSPDEKWLAVSAQNLELWRLDAWTNALSVKSPNMKAGSRAAGIGLMLLATLGGHLLVTEAVFGTQPAGPAVFSPDGQYLAEIHSAAGLGNALGLAEKQVRIFQLATGALLSTILPGGDVQSLAFSPDGAFLATAGQGVELWDWRSGKPARATALPNQDTRQSAQRARVVPSGV